MTGKFLPVRVARWGETAPPCAAAPEKFFPYVHEGGEPERAALKEAQGYCGLCPYRVECLEFGMDADYGIYAGTTPAMRRELRKGRVIA